MPGRLIICATPIGNLDDAPPRLAEALAAAAVVYAEDTRRSRVLLDHLGVSATLRSYFVGNEEARSTELKERLERGDTLALITDAGMPAISDPGLSAVAAAVDAGAEVSVIPGPSAVTSALAVSGLPADRFAFEGFLPRKTGDRTRRLRELSSESRTTVVFTAPSRAAQDLADLAAALGEDRPVVVARELTKAHEEVYRGTLEEAHRRWSRDVEPRGEFTLVIAGSGREPPSMDALLSEVEAGIAAGASLSAVVREVAEDAGVSRRRLYEAALRARDGA